MWLLDLLQHLPGVLSVPLTEILILGTAGVLPQRDWAGDDFGWSKPMADLLNGTFDLETWRPNQKEIVNATLSGRDVFVVMRTGGGKSLCYQLPALLKGGITIGTIHACVCVLVAGVLYTKEYYICTFCCCS